MIPDDIRLDIWCVLWLPSFPPWVVFRITKRREGEGGTPAQKVIGRLTLLPYCYPVKLFAMICNEIKPKVQIRIYSIY